MVNHLFFMLKTTPTRCKGRSSAGLLGRAMPTCTGWRSVSGSSSVPFKTPWMWAGFWCCPFPFLFLSSKGVLWKRNEVRVKRRRNEMRELLCISGHLLPLPVRPQRWDQWWPWQKWRGLGCRSIKKRMWESTTSLPHLGMALVTKSCVMYVCWHCSTPAG